MSAPSEPPDRPDPLAALAGELGHLGRRLDGIGAELLALRAPAEVAPVPPVAGAESGPPRSVRPPPPLPPTSVPQRDRPPYPVPYPMPYPVPQPFPGPPTVSRSQRPGSQTHLPPRHGAPAHHPVPAAPTTGSRPPVVLSGARLLAWTGGAITLVGVVLVLVLAASREWFTPPARIAAGAMLAVVLVGIGIRLYRKESARVGALALVATGFATAYLVVAATAALYDYLAPVPALTLALLVAGAGLGVADRWRTELLAGGATVGAVVLAPVLAEGWLLVALALALQVAALPVVLRRGWSTLMVLAAAGPVLFGTLVISGGGFGAGTDRVQVVVVALAVLAVGLGTSVPAARLLPAASVATLVGSSSVPSFVAVSVLGGWAGGALGLGVALALAGLASVPGTDRAIRLVAGTAASSALLQATATALDGSSFTLVVLGQAIVAAVVAGSFRNRFALVMGTAYGTIGTFAAITSDAPLVALVRLGEPYVVNGVGRPGAMVVGAAVSASVLVLACALLMAGGRFRWVRPDAATARIWVPIGFAALYGAAGLVIPLALLVSADRIGFTVGHAVVTVSWTIAALVLLAQGISRPALRVAGLVLVAAAVAKLMLFDLVALDGVARAAAFLGAGLVLLAAGARYARLVAESESESESEPEPSESGPPDGPAPSMPRPLGADR